MTATHNEIMHILIRLPSRDHEGVYVAEVFEHEWLSGWQTPYWSKSATIPEPTKLLYSIRSFPTQDLLGGFIAPDSYEWSGPVEIITEAQYETYKEFDVDQLHILSAFQVVEIRGKELK